MMNKNIKSLILIVCIMIPYTHLQAQQNLFNIPSGDITPTKKWFYQHQINAYSLSKYESKSHLVYGLAKSFDVGLNVINIPISFKSHPVIKQNDDRSNGPLFPAALLTSQYQLKFHPKLYLNSGGMYGINIPSSIDHTSFLFQLYSLMMYKPTSSLRILSGPYYANKNLVGNNASIGIMAGFEYILHPKLYLMGDYVSGNNASSSAVLGFNYNLTHRIQLCLGGLLATPDHEYKPGVVFELNLLGYDLDH
jgi:hypothetical protein